MTFGHAQKQKTIDIIPEMQENRRLYTREIESHCKIIQHFPAHSSVVHHSSSDFNLIHEWWPLKERSNSVQLAVDTTYLYVRALQKSAVFRNFSFLPWYVPSTCKSAADDSTSGGRNLQSY